MHADRACTPHMARSKHHSLTWETYLEVSACAWCGSISGIGNSVGTFLCLGGPPKGAGGIMCSVCSSVRQYTPDFVNMIDLSCVQTRSLLPGTLWRGLIFFTTYRPHYILKCIPTFRGQSRLSGFGCALDHSATTFCACAHLMKTAVRYQLRAQGRSPLPGPNMFGGTTGRSPGKRPHYGIDGKVPLSGTFPGKRDLVWTRG